TAFCYRYDSRLNKAPSSLGPTEWRKILPIEAALGARPILAVRRRHMSGKISRLHLAPAFAPSKRLALRVVNEIEQARTRDAHTARPEPDLEGHLSWLKSDRKRLRGAACLDLGEVARCALPRERPLAPPASIELRIGPRGLPAT